MIDEIGLNSYLDGKLIFHNGINFSNLGVDVDIIIGYSEIQ